MTQRATTFLISLCAVVVGTSAVLAQPKTEPRKALLQLVGADAGVCIEIIDGNGTIAAFQKSRLWNRIEKLPAFQKWLKSRELAELNKMQSALGLLAGKDIDKVLRDLLGRHVVFAIYPGKDAPPEGVVLLRAADSKELQRLVAIFEKAGPHKVEEKTHTGKRYRKRTAIDAAGKPGPIMFYTVVDKVFAISDSEAQIQTLLDRVAKTPKDNLWTDNTHRTARRAAHANNFLFAFVNPRPWDASLANARKSDSDRTLWEAWDLLEWGYIGLRFDEGLVGELSVGYRGSSAPNKWKEWVRSLKPNPEFLRTAPATAMVVLGGSSSPGSVVPLLQSDALVPKKKLNTFLRISRGLLMGLDPFKDVLPATRAQWGMMLLPPPSENIGPVPLAGLLAIGLNDKAENAAEVRSAFDNALRTGLNVLSVWINAESRKLSPKSEKLVQAVVKQEETRDKLMRYIGGTAPLNPGYLLQPRWMLLASHPALLRRFDAPAKRLVDDARFDRVRTQFLEKADHFLLLNIAAIEKWLAAHSTAIAGMTGKPADQFGREMKEMLQVVRVVDLIFATARITEDRIRIQAGITLFPAGKSD